MTVITPIAEAPPGHQLVNRSLIDAQLWNRLVNRIVNDKSLGRPMELSLAERIMDQALGLLVLYTHEPQGCFGPSWQVVPTLLNQLLADPDKAKASRVNAARLSMRKLSIAELQAAADAA